MKKITKAAAIIMAFVFAFSFCLTGFAERFEAELDYDGTLHEYSSAYFKVIIEGKKIESPIPPIVLENDRSIVAVREIFEAMGADVLWTQGNPSRVLISKGEDIVSLAIGDDIAIVNGKNVKMDIAAKLVGYNGVYKTMVPVRFVSETLGMEVAYEDSTATIYISSPTPTPTPTPTLTPTPTPIIKKYIEKITYSNTATSFDAKIALSESYGYYNDFVLSNPDGVVVDIEGFDVDKLKPEYSIGGFVSKIRTGAFEGCGRIVFDLESATEYVISLSADKKTINISIKIKASTQTPTPTPKITSKPTPTPTHTPKKFTSASDCKIVIDAGHGGSDPGAMGYDDEGNLELNEKDVTLAVSKLVCDILKKNGADVYYTRDKDVYVSLEDRANYANKIGATLFISIHCNAFTNEDVSGTLVMHHTSKDTSEYGVSGREIATNILTYLPKALGTQNKGRMDGSAMYVIRKVDMPSVIVEMAFITNKSDREKLSDGIYQRRAAQAIADGIMDTIESLIE